MTRPLLRLLTCLLALGATTAVLAACGGGDEDVDEILAQTFGGDAEPVQSGRLTLSFGLDAEGLQQSDGPVTVRLSGPFAGSEDGAPRFDLDAALSASGQNVTAGAVSTGEQGFLKFQGNVYDVGDELYAQFRQTAEQARESQPDRRGDASFASLGIDPSRWLTDAENEGTEEVGGAQTIHISGGIDVAAMLEDINTLLGRAGELGVTGQQEVPNELTEQQRTQIADAVQDAKVDIYTGEDDKLLRRLRLDVAFEVPEDQRTAAGGLQSGDITLDLTIADLNEEQEIATPEGARPLSELTGGAAPSAGATPPGAGQAPTGEAAPEAEAPALTAPSATTPAPNEPGANEEYLRCLQEAGDDVRQVQGCARLLATP